MKNKTALIALMLLSCSLASGQFHFGIRGGINVSKLKTSDEFVTGDFRITYPNYALLGFHAGLISQVQFFNFMFQPELLYTNTRNDINVYDLNSSDPDEALALEQKLNRIDIPLLLGYKIKFLKLEAGPVVTFLISDDSDLKRITSYDMQLNKATIGFQAGGGIDVGKLAFDIKYEGSLSKLGDGISIGSSTMAFDSRISQVILSVGLFFW